MTTEMLTDKVPTYVHNKHTTYENTVLQEHSSIVSGLQDTGTDKSLIEAQGRLLIGLCLKDKANDFLNERYQVYYDEEYKKISSAETTPDRKAIAINRTLLRLITDAMSIWIAKYKVDGSKAKIAIIDDILPDGRRILEPDELLKLVTGLLPVGYKIVKDESSIPLDKIEANIIIDGMPIVDYADDEVHCG